MMVGCLWTLRSFPIFQWCRRSSPQAIQEALQRKAQRMHQGPPYFIKHRWCLEGLIPMMFRKKVLNFWCQITLLQKLSDFLVSEHTMWSNQKFEYSNFWLLHLIIIKLCAQTILEVTVVFCCWFCLQEKDLAELRAKKAQEGSVKGGRQKLRPFWLQIWLVIPSGK